MLSGLRKRFSKRPVGVKESEDDEKDDLQTFSPPTRYINISQGKIQLVHQTRSLESEPTIGLDKNEKDLLEHRIVDLEAALVQLQEKMNNNHCVSPTFEKELREQLENMNRLMKSKERKQVQTCRDYKALQNRFARQENMLQTLQRDNKALVLRIRQYEILIDDVMRKVVDAIVLEDSLREEVTMLKNRVHDLEAQNAALSSSPAKGRDEGYCTMSSGPPQPSNGQLEDLPEEPEQWLLPAEPCSTEMEDWSMSQEELAVITLDDEREHQQHQELYRQRYLQKHGVSEHDWIWKSNDFLSSSSLAEHDGITDGIAQLLQQKIVYSEDEEVTCTDFTNDFYKLVNIRPSSARSLYSYIEGDTDDEDDEDDEHIVNGIEADDDDDEAEDSSLAESMVRLRNTSSNFVKVSTSPTPSEAGRAQLTSCSSSSVSSSSALQTSPEATTAVQQQENKAATSGNSTMACLKDQSVMNGAELCVVKTINQPILMRSKSTMDENEPICVVRQNHRRDIVASVVRSESINCGIALKTNHSNVSVLKPKERLLQRAGNSWRKSHGWKRVKSPAQTLISPKHETKTELLKSFQSTPKILPTKIPTSIASATSTNTATQKPLAQPILSSNPSQAMRKSKIPPPVPVRRSCAS